MSENYISVDDSNDNETTPSTSLLSMIFRSNNPWITIITALLSIACYKFIFGWVGSAVFVLLLLVHEMGHVWFTRWRHIPASIPIFIPFLGAMINIKSDNVTPQDEAWIGIGGPLTGGIGATIVLLIGVIWFPDMKEGVGLAIMLGIVLNLFNLLPIRPLDGGRIVQILGRWTQVLGILCLAIATFFIRGPVMILIWFFVLTGLDFGKKEKIVTLKEKFIWGVAYVVLVFFLIIALRLCIQLAPLPTFLQ